MTVPEAFLISIAILLASRREGLALFFFACMIMGGGHW